MHIVNQHGSLAPHVFAASQASASRQMHVAVRVLPSADAKVHMFRTKTALKIRAFVHQNIYIPKNKSIYLSHVND